MFHGLIPLLADGFHLPTLGLPGFGKSGMPRGDFGYTFEHLTDDADRLTERLGLDGFRFTCLTVARRSGSGSPPGTQRITEIISQNGNLYAEELSDCWNPVRDWWKDPSEANREAIRTYLVPQTAIWQRPRHKAGQPRRLRARQLPPRSQRRG